MFEVYRQDSDFVNDAFIKEVQHEIAASLSATFSLVLNSEIGRAVAIEALNKHVDELWPGGMLRTPSGC
jgi:hypothetical protein